MLLNKFLTARFW